MENDWTKVLGFPGYRVYQQEIDEEHQQLKLWIRRKRGNRSMTCAGCGRRVHKMHEVYEREIRDLPCFEYQTTVVVELYRVDCPACGVKAENDETDRYEFAGNMSKIWGKHTIKFGGMYGLGLYPMHTVDNTTGTYSSTNAFTQGPNPLSASTTSGFGYASYLLGTMSAGTQDPTRIIGS